MLRHVDFRQKYRIDILAHKDIYLCMSKFQVHALEFKRVVLLSTRARSRHVFWFNPMHVLKIRTKTTFELILN